MNIQNIVEAINATRNGAMCRVEYKSEMPLKAASKKEGISIIKITESTVRFGVDYDNIGTVIERRSAEDYQPAHREYDRTWIVDNKVYHNNKNGTDYIRFANVNNHANKHASFIVRTPDSEIIVSELTDEQKGHVIDSYWNKEHTTPEIQDIRAENIIRIGKAVLA